MTVLGPSLNQIDHILSTCHNLLLEAFNIDTLLNVLSNMEIDRCGLKQVHDLLIVDFKVRTSYKIFELLLLLRVFSLLNRLFDAVEDVLEGSLHDASFLFVDRV